MGKPDEVLVNHFRSHISHIDDIIHAPSFKLSSVGSSPVETSPTTPSFIYLKPEEIDYHCLHRILNALSDSLYDIYYEYKLKNYGQLSRMNTTSMMLESKDSPPPPSINS